MQISVTQLQAYNAMFKLLDSYYNITESSDAGVLLTMMSFLKDGTTSDAAIWNDWLKVINGRKRLTKQEAFDCMIKFLQIYRSFEEEGTFSIIINKLSAAENCDDTSVPFVRQWNLSLKEALSEPEGTREYFRLMKQTRKALVWLRGFNTVYKFLNMYGKQGKLEDITRLAQGMLFLPERGNVDPDASDTWSAAVDYKLMLTKEEVFDGTIRFLEAYQEKLHSDNIAQLIKALRSVISFDDITILLVQQWNDCFEEALSESVGTREYVEARD